MVVPLPSKQEAGVRFPLLAPILNPYFSKHIQKVFTKAHFQMKKVQEILGFSFFEETKNRE